MPVSPDPAATPTWRWKPVDIVVLVIAFAVWWPLGLGVLTAGFILAVMVLPFIASVMRDVFSTVPVILQANDSGLDVATVANGGITYAGFHPIALVVASDSPAKTSKARRSASRVSTISCISSSSNGSASMAPIRRRSISSKPISSRCPIS